MALDANIIVVFGRSSGHDKNWPPGPAGRELCVLYQFVCADFLFNDRHGSVVRSQGDTPMRIC
jgi:hypothetical protein